MTQTRTRDEIRPICRYRKALHEYEIMDRLEAGIVLVGSEVKSLRNGRGNLNDSFVRFNNGEAWLVNAHISAYPQANRENHEPLRERKLLLRAAEIRRLMQRVREKGFTVIALSMYFKGPHIKVELGVGRGKKLYDKRADLKEKQDKRDMERSRASEG